MEINPRAAGDLPRASGLRAGQDQLQKMAEAILRPDLFALSPPYPMTVDRDWTHVQRSTSRERPQSRKDNPVHHLWQLAWITLRRRLGESLRRKANWAHEAPQTKVRAGCAGEAGLTACAATEVWAVFLRSGLDGQLSKPRLRSLLRLPAVRAGFVEASVRHF